LALIAALIAYPTLASAQPKSRLPERLSDGEFWVIVTAASERGGDFYLENWISNEPQVGRIVGLLNDIHLKGGAYIGVGPEQNFSYIAAIRPEVAFVVDIRRQALIQQLLYKAIFELSVDRADFVSTLFSRNLLPAVDSETTIEEILNAVRAATPDTVMHKRDSWRIREWLMIHHQFALNDDDVHSLSYVFDTFFSAGPEITTGTMGGSSGPLARKPAAGLGFTTLMSRSFDAHGNPQGFLTSDSAYSFVRELQLRNLVIPVVGDFAGAKAIRTIGRYLADRAISVSAFYVSNVEQYLYDGQRDHRFYANVASLPITSKSVFIRPDGLRADIRGRTLCPIKDFLAEVRSGAVNGWTTTLACGSGSRNPH
jgi:hypothetical protein